MQNYYLPVRALQMQQVAGLELNRQDAKSVKEGREESREEYQPNLEFVPRSHAPAWECRFRRSASAFGVGRHNPVRRAYKTAFSRRSVGTRNFSVQLRNSYFLSIQLPFLLLPLGTLGVLAVQASRRIPSQTIIHFHRSSKKPDDTTWSSSVETPQSPSLGYSNALVPVNALFPNV